MYHREQRMCAGGMGVRLSEERLRQLVDMAGGEDALRESERRYRDNLQYLETHHEELAGLYPGEWIGILDRQVRAHAGDANDVVCMIEDSGESLDGMVLHFMRTDDTLWLL